MLTELEPFLRMEFGKLELVLLPGSWPPILEELLAFLLLLTLPAPVLSAAVWTEGLMVVCQGLLVWFEVAILPLIPPTEATAGVYGPDGGALTVTVFMCVSE